MISVVYCTRESKPSHKEHIIKTSGLHKYIEVIEIVNNGESLTKSYNRGLKMSNHDIVVFCHDDITIETKQWGNKLLKHFEKNPDYGIIGVAGTKYLSSSGRWWDDRKMMYGRVKHTHQGKSWLSTYSDDLDKAIEEVVLVDGLFFAVDKRKLKLNDLNQYFDESVEGFHFYDVDFCFNNFINKSCKIGVITTIRINHQSIGETNEKWEDNRKIFVEKNKNNLPQRIIEPFTRRKLKVMLPVLNTTNELTDILELAKELTNLNCIVTVVSNFEPKDLLFAKRFKIKTYTLKEPPSYLLGDGVFQVPSPNGPIPSEEGRIYKVMQADFDIIYLENSDMLKAYKVMYPECKFVDLSTDEYEVMDKTPENYKNLFVNTFNSDATIN